MLYPIVVHLRAMQLFYHSAHNLVKGSLFFQDHTAFGDFYEVMSCNYDMVIERAIPLEGDEIADPPKQLKDVYKILKGKDISSMKDNKAIFIESMTLEKELCSLIESQVTKEGISEGTKQLIGEIANQSEGRQYLISRRIK